MAKLLKGIEKLMKSAGYAIKDSFTSKQVGNYFNARYHGAAQYDASGKTIDSDVVDEATFRKICDEIEDNNDEVMDAIDEWLDEVNEDLPDGVIINTEPEIDTEIIKVIDENGNIRTENIDIYSWEAPETDEFNDEYHSKYIWCAEDDACDECADLAGQIFTEDEIPDLPHPNCRCWTEPYDEDENTKDKPHHISKKGLNFLKQKEGKVTENGKHVIYDDKTGKPVSDKNNLPKGATIGYGHLLKPGEKFSNGITEKHAERLLAQDVARFENIVKSDVKAELTQSQFDALVALAYNIGPNAFENSTLLQYLNDSNFSSTKYPTIESAWKAWNKSGGSVSRGLNNRRDAEWNLFNDRN
ncbi:MAG: glycoside hydrolase family protein [Rickettsiales bacterium]|nr:glycoside hydrolase family protein [Rickettsiales bacterium]